ncbi:predicted protein [Nematostella vectensis]|uniref:Kazal-like domain-containing protein n=1 Tax=Nematostella vectensis TaxID=45351 RepID=A7RGA2_NEMVE|nr:predicted protein [Nematostella vectensis]|eukprot:XP_001641556.1 predicted protein [Nematostella vectensis]
MKVFLTVLLGASLASLGQGMLFGRGTFLVSSPSDFLCKTIPFSTPFATDSVHVQITLHMDEQSGPTYEAAVNWVEQVCREGFTTCVSASGPVSGNRTVTVQWLAYTSIPDNKGLHSTVSIDRWTAGTKCTAVDFVAMSKSFPSAPYVFVTAVHDSQQKKHDSAIVWAEDVTSFGFQICLRELKNYDGVHESVKAAWLALEEVPTGWDIPYESVVTLPNLSPPKSTEHYSYCQTVSFAKPFYQKPVMITTSKHYTDPSDPKAIHPKNNAITEWVEDITVNNFKVCMKDIQPYGGHHDPVSISYLAVGYLNPCENMQCTHYATCKAYGPKDARCECAESCPTYDDERCGSDGVTYKNDCLYKKYICETRLNVTIVHLGGCQHFILHRGRVTLDLSTSDVKCELVTFSPKNFAKDRLVYVQASINYYNTPDQTFVHDAAVTWAENINIYNFTLCGLKVGRNDRATPDNGATYVDYIAHQGTPVGAVVGEITLAEWWQETKCQDVPLPSDKFSTTPTVFVTSEHMVVGQKHDAATIWVENPSNTSITVCLREMQNFDGLHKDINVNWIAASSLPAEMNSELKTLFFPNTNLPLPADNFAYCQDVALSNYTSVPNVIVSAVHKQSFGSTIPEYNSISVWVEYITIFKFRVCIKELHTPNGYDSVFVSAIVMDLKSHGRAAVRLTPFKSNCPLCVVGIYRPEEKAELDGKIDEALEQL